MSELMERIQKEGLLDLNRHATLLADIDSIAETAGIPVSSIYHSMKEVCTLDELKFARDLWLDPKTAGVVYIHDVYTMPRMMAVTAACLRNFVDARIILMAEIVRAIKEGNAPKCDVVLIPNFCIAAKDKGIADWEMTHVLGWMLDRHFSGLKTLVSISKKEDVQKVMGQMMIDHLKNFVEIPAGILPTAK